MIERILIENYRRFDRLVILPRPGMNILVGDNEAGKSTVLEAVALALTGRINGHWAGDEKNPFWFHKPTVDNFFAKYGTKDQVEAPMVQIEVYLSVEDSDPDVHRLRGVINSETEAGTKTDCPGVRLRVRPSDEYKAEFAEYMKDPPTGVLPTEYYECIWTDFDGRVLSRRPKALGSAFIDSKTLRSSTGIDYHTRQILDSFMDEKERVQVAVEHRKNRHALTTGVLAEVSKKVQNEGAELDSEPLSLAMDQSARAAWEADVVPQVADIPFGMSGQGRQASVKVALAMHRNADRVRYVLIEEPEIHQSYTSLRILLKRIQNLAGIEQQVFVSTHSSFVLNRLGLDRLHLLGPSGATRLTQLSEDTVRYFQHLSGYDTLRIVLGRRLVLVEGPSDEMVFERCFRDRNQQKSTDESGIDVVSMSGITFKRALELCALLDREAVALQDNDGAEVADILGDPELAQHLSDMRHMCVGDTDHGRTLEPQLIDANGVARMKKVLELRDQDNPTTWMPNHKTESALRILLSPESIAFPAYIEEAVALVSQ